MTRRCYHSAFILIFLIFLSIVPLQAAGEFDDVPVCRAVSEQNTPLIISDGEGESIITWQDNRSSVWNIYAQKLDFYGDTLWTLDGAPVCTISVDVGGCDCTSDGNGGMIVSWLDNRIGDLHSNIYSQRIDNNGNALWLENGIIACAAEEGQLCPRITSDGTGGAIITWLLIDYSQDIYAQRVDATGDTLWGENGVGIETSGALSSCPFIISDDAGGAIIAWEDSRGSGSIYAQRIDASGNTLWTKDGIPITTHAWGDLVLIADGSGGAVTVWEDDRGGYYAQRFDASGDTLWTKDGIMVGTAVTPLTVPAFVSDGNGGALVAWESWHDTYFEAIVQRIDANGNTLWGGNGVVLSEEGSYALQPNVTSDGAGGAFVIWWDQRGGLYAQRIDFEGNLEWSSGGIFFCSTIANSIRSDFPIIPDGSGGALVSWVDDRDVGTTNNDIYATIIHSNGHVGFDPSPLIIAAADVPRDQGGKIQLQWARSYLDITNSADITHYSVWRRVAALGNGSALMAEQSSEQPAIPIDFEGSAVRRASDGFAWEWLDNVPAHFFETYALTVESLYDSLGSDPGWQYFMVSAQTSDPVVFYDSAIDSGYSVDNLSPYPPQMVMGEQVVQPEGLALSWERNTELDLFGYAVYRGSTEEFIPGPGNLIASPTDTTVFDTEWRWDSGFYYKIAAVDVHGNESPYALLRPEDVTGAGLSDVPRFTYLRQNIPNPFNPTTRIEYGLDEPEWISLRVYDVSGREVRVLVDGWRAAENHEAVWDGRDANGDPVATGVYLYRLVTGRQALAKKMVLVK